MSPEPTSFHGQCHCGNVEVTFETKLRVEELRIRACSCSFCRSHGARTTSDPSGKVKITVHDSSQLIRYRFGLKTADFLVCGRCGVYLGAVMKAGEETYATVNTRTFDHAEKITQEPLIVTYEGETEAERKARREANWTPVAAFD
ncbi:MAG: GFA family protein [Candidatus Binatia bacterium]